jgi:hypothetical protein
MRSAGQTAPDLSSSVCRAQYSVVNENRILKSRHFGSNHVLSQHWHRTIEERLTMEKINHWP